MNAPSLAPNRYPRPRWLIQEDHARAEAAGDLDLCRRFADELRDATARAEPFYLDCGRRVIKPEWRRSMSPGETELLEIEAELAGLNPERRIERLLHGQAVCFRGFPIGDVLRNGNGLVDLQYGRCSLALCPVCNSVDPAKSRGGVLQVEWQHLRYKTDVMAPATLWLEAPRFLVVLLGLDLGEVPAKQAVRIARDYGRWTEWLSRENKRSRNYAAIRGPWLGEYSVGIGLPAPLAPSASRINSLGTPSSSLHIRGSQSAMQLVFPLLLVLGYGASVELDVIESRWRRMKKNEGLAPRINVATFPDVESAWETYLVCWARTWFEGKNSLQLARQLLAWTEARMNVRGPLGQLHGQVRRLQDMHREDRRRERVKEGWKVVGRIEEMGMPRKELSRWVHETNERILRCEQRLDDHDHRISTLEGADAGHCGTSATSSLRASLRAGPAPALKRERPVYSGPSHGEEK